MPAGSVESAAAEQKSTARSCTDRAVLFYSLCCAETYDLRAVSATCRGSLVRLLHIVRLLCIVHLLRFQRFLSLALSPVLQNLRVRCPLHNLRITHMEGAGCRVLDRRVRGERQHRKHRNAQLEENRGQRQGLMAPQHTTGNRREVQRCQQQSQATSPSTSRATYSTAGTGAPPNKLLQNPPARCR